MPSGKLDPGAKYGGKRRTPLSIPVYSDRERKNINETATRPDKINFRTSQRDKFSEGELKDALPEGPFSAIFGSIVNAVGTGFELLKRSFQLVGSFGGNLVNHIRSLLHLLDWKEEVKGQKTLIMFLKR